MQNVTKPSKKRCFFFKSSKIADQIEEANVERKKYVCERECIGDLSMPSSWQLLKCPRINQISLSMQMQSIFFFVAFVHTKAISLRFRRR